MKILMHLNTPVAKIQMVKNQINKVEVLDDKFFPQIKDETPLNSFRRWYISRRISYARKDISPLIAFYGANAFTSKTLRSHSDWYWMKDEKDNISWGNVLEYPAINEDQIFNYIVNPKDAKESVDSPNLTISSRDPIFWYNYNSRFGVVNFSANEDMNRWKFSDSTHKDLFAHREYIVVRSLLATFVERDYSEFERVPFDELLLSVYDKNLNNNENLQKTCEFYNIPDWEKFIKNLCLFNNEATENNCKKINLAETSVLRDKNGNLTGFEKL